MLITKIKTIPISVLVCFICLPPSINLSTSIAQIFLKYSWKIFILIKMNYIV